MLRRAEREDVVLLTTLASELLPGHPVPDFTRILEGDVFCVVDDAGGYLLARLDRWNGERVAFVISAAALRTVPEASRKEAYSLLESWCRDRWVGKILTMTRTPEVFLKRWGFKLESFVISKNVTLASPERRK